MVSHIHVSAHNFKLKTSAQSTSVQYTREKNLAKMSACFSIWLMTTKHSATVLIVF